MIPKNAKKIILFSSALFVGVYLINLVFVFRSSPLLVPFQTILKTLIKYSSVIVIAGYISYFAVFVWLVDVCKRSIELKRLVQIVSFSGLGAVFAWLFFVFLDKVNYHNYVFSTYDIYLPSLERFANFQTIVLISGYYTFWYLKNHKQNVTKKYVFPIVIIILFVNVFLGNITKFVDIVSNEMKFLSQYYHSQGKLEKTPDFITLKRWSSFINLYTESNSAIIHPVQSDEYPVIGNQPLARYFLYPRTLVSTTFADQYIKDNKNINIYYIFKKANSLPGEYFPSKETNFKKAYILFMDGTIKEYSNSDFLMDFEKIYDKIDIGVLKK
jgi:hypothetical protein